MIDIDQNLCQALSRIGPDIVIHTTGPFQHQDHRVAQACIHHGSHYLDLADARDFVTSIHHLDAQAREKNVLIVSGASSVPCLTAAIIDHYRPQFAQIDALDYGITAAQQTNRGVATTAAILSYVGKPFKRLHEGHQRRSFGWQDMHRERYPELGVRWFGDCDIPDLDLFPTRYPGLKSIRFCAGHQIPALHFGTWALSWLVRVGLIDDLSRYAASLLKIAFLFDRLGSDRSGLHMFMSGTGLNGRPKRMCFFLIARSAHGPYIPCMPAIILTQKLAAGALPDRGARPCLDLINLEEYLMALGKLDISVMVDPPHA
jgi:hypothetical protein